MAGYITKKGGFNTWSYKHRWMVLEGSTLYYFTSPSGELKGTIELTGAKIQREKDKTKFSIEKSERTYEMQVTSERERNTWVTKCQEAIGGVSHSALWAPDAHSWQSRHQRSQVLTTATI